MGILKDGAGHSRCVCVQGYPSCAEHSLYFSNGRKYVMKTPKSKYVIVCLCVNILDGITIKKHCMLAKSYLSVFL